MSARMSARMSAGTELGVRGRWGSENEGGMEGWGDVGVGVSKMGESGGVWGSKWGFYGGVWGPKMRVGGVGGGERGVLSTPLYIISQAWSPTRLKSGQGSLWTFSGHLNRRELTYLADGRGSRQTRDSLEANGVLKCGASCAVEIVKRGCSLETKGGHTGIEIAATETPERRRGRGNASDWEICSMGESR
jgi:hypothetical protein